MKKFEIPELALIYIIENDVMTHSGDDPNEGPVIEIPTIID